LKYRIPEGYKSQLDLFETQLAIKSIKDYFQKSLSSALKLTRVTAPLFVRPETGLNDYLTGVERPVSFGIKEQNDAQVEIVQSLAKWKRYALKKYGFPHGTGLYTDMNAIRRDEKTDAIHSIYVDQWDWEKIISREERNLDTLKEVVKRIFCCLRATEAHIISEFPVLGKPVLPDEITFVTAQQLEDEYPDLAPAEREYEAVKRHGAIFIIGIGGALKSGRPHDKRASDYDDWNLNGDIILHNKVLDIAFEISSMGIRVDAESLAEQLKITGQEHRASHPFQKALLNNELPLTIGGGIGQSRICMFLLRKAHIGEVQCSVWTEETVRMCGEAGINLL
jgi:aspartate--ammonia ligase